MRAVRRYCVTHPYHDAPDGAVIIDKKSNTVSARSGSHWTVWEPTGKETLADVEKALENG